MLCQGRVCQVESSCVKWSQAVLSGVGLCQVELDCVELSQAVLSLVGMC